MDRLSIFETELDYISNPQIRKFTEEVLLNVPEYFFKIPASSSGRYHPSYALGEGGLVRHTKAAVGIAVELFKVSVKGYTDEEKDIVISALILHDTAKNGFEGSSGTITEHPLEITKFIYSNSNLKSILPKETLNTILSCINSHMGKWNFDYKNRKAVLPKPQSRLEQLVHMADYIASRKCLEYNFDVKVSMN